MQALDDYEAASGGKPTVEGALHAYLDTDLDLYIQGGENWKNYGALGALMSGSGSSVFGVVENEAQGRKIWSGIRKKYPQSWLVHTV